MCLIFHRYFYLNIIVCERTLSEHYYVKSVFKICYKIWLHSWSHCRDGKKISSWNSGCVARWDLFYQRQGARTKPYLLWQKEVLYLPGDLSSSPVEQWQLQEAIKNSVTVLLCSLEWCFCRVSASTVLDKVNTDLFLQGWTAFPSHWVPTRW